LASSEARDSRFLPLFFEVAEKSPALAEINDLSTPVEELEQARMAFRNEAPRAALERYLEERMAQYRRLAERDERVPRFASMFVNDRRGNQLASAFDDQSISKSIGKNWAHRTYFHGGPEELPEFERPPENPQHIASTHLSAVFPSTTQKVWKVAISTPIEREVDGKRQFEGILALTVDVSDFRVSTASMSPEEDRFLVLVDGRSGDERGTIVHHPLFRDLAAKGKSVPQKFFDDPEFRVSAEQLAGRGDANYQDPMSRYKDLPEVSSHYDRRWLAASAPVLPPIGASQHSESGLVVLVQSDYQSVVLPARQLGQQFIKNSFWMFVVMATVSLALWYIVVRLFREPTAALGRPATPVPASVPAYGQTTVAAGRPNE
jgi:hypothetical protein